MWHSNHYRHLRIGISPKRPRSGRCWTFDSFPHEWRLLKADYYGIRNKTKIWLRSFLTGRSQGVVTNGSASSWSPVVSGVPQGTVLGSILFLMFINDLLTNTASGIKLFADDCVLYRPINSESDHFVLQRDLDQLEKWAYTTHGTWNLLLQNVLLCPSLWRILLPSLVTPFVMRSSTVLATKSTSATI